MIEVVLHSGRLSRTVLMPEGWAEINPKQMALVADVLFADLTAEELDVFLVVILSGINKKELRNCSAEVMHNNLIPLIEWAKKECTLTQQLFPVISNKWGADYYGPDSELDNLRLAEYDCAEKELHAWQNTITNNELEQDNNLLYRFIACLYRKSKKNYKPTDTDRREAFNQGAIQINAEKLKKLLPIGNALAIALWYRACKAKISELYAELFEGDDNNQEQSSIDNFPLMRMIAKSGIYGDFEKVEQMYLYTALTELSESLKEQQRIEEQNQQNQSDE